MNHRRLHRKFQIAFHITMKSALEKSIIAEVTVFASKDKDLYLKIQKEVKDSVPLGIMLVMYIVKLLFYRLEIISHSTYRDIKAALLNQKSGKEFVSID